MTGYAIALRRRFGRRLAAVLPAGSCSWRQSTILLALAVLVSGCASSLEGPAELAADSDSVARQAADCIRLLQQEPMSPSRSTAQWDGSRQKPISLLSWNVRKGRHGGWAKEFAARAGDVDLVLLQEALSAHTVDGGENQHHRVFAPGYQTERYRSGLLTLSRFEPIAQCHLSYREPWLRSPKTTLVTQYAIDDSGSTLVVANVHAINFTFGMRRFGEQIRELQEILRAHQGPLVVSGDLNTWRKGRQAFVAELTADIGLEAVRYRSDRRKRFFGWPLDHLYVRGFEQVNATTHPTTTSDHVPITAQFAL